MGGDCSRFYDLVLKTCNTNNVSCVGLLHTLGKLTIKEVQTSDTGNCYIRHFSNFSILSCYLLWFRSYHQDLLVPPDPPSVNTTESYHDLVTLHTPIQSSFVNLLPRKGYHLGYEGY